MPNLPNRCPAPGCGKVIRHHDVACAFHWYTLPLELRVRLWNLYRHEPGGSAHVRAIGEAMRLLRGAA